MNEDMTVRKVAAHLPFSFEVLMDMGAMTEEQAREMGWTPPPPIPRLRRWRYAIELWWYDHKPRVHLGPCDHRDCS